MKGSKGTLRKVRTVVAYLVKDRHTGFMAEPEPDMLRYDSCFGLTWEGVDLPIVLYLEVKGEGRRAPTARRWESSGQTLKPLTTLRGFYGFHGIGTHNLYTYVHDGEGNRKRITADEVRGGFDEPELIDIGSVEGDQPVSELIDNTINHPGFAEMQRHLEWQKAAGVWRDRA